MTVGIAREYLAHAWLAGSKEDVARFCLPADRGAAADSADQIAAFDL
jgi:hypothetical protein